MDGSDLEKMRVFNRGLRLNSASGFSTNNGRHLKKIPEEDP